EVDTVTFSIFDADNNLIESFGGNKPKYEETGGSSWWSRFSSTKPTTAKGINTFTWNLRYPGPTTFDGIIIWGASATTGPKAPLGDYTIQMKVGPEVIKSYPFKIEMDPNLKGITAEDLQKQFELASKITEKATIANEAVIQIRSIRKQIDSLGKGVSSRKFTKLSEDFMEALTEIENDLYQTKNQSGQDPLNFPIKLNNRFNALQRSIENGDARPTDAAYVVYDELTAELDGHMAKLNSTLEKELPKVNAILQDNGVSNISLD
ncbi:MAG: glycosyl hydrolase, partial [Bacteroidota bacterium]|nr:glycosyl hydrolase [Bacteroidota bacterium]